MTTILEKWKKVRSTVMGNLLAQGTNSYKQSYIQLLNDFEESLKELCESRKVKFKVPEVMFEDESEKRCHHCGRIIDLSVCRFCKIPSCPKCGVRLDD